MLFLVCVCVNGSNQSDQNGKLFYPHTQFLQVFLSKSRSEEDVDMVLQQKCDDSGVQDQGCLDLCKFSTTVNEVLNQFF